MDKDTEDAARMFTLLSKISPKAVMFVGLSILDMMVKDELITVFKGEMVSFKKFKFDENNVH